MNIPARYCTGYLGDLGTPPPWGTMDFAGWFEAYLGDRWYTFDARNNTPRIGRVLIARGRDACDVALTSTFGPNTLERFTVCVPIVVPEPRCAMTYCVGVKLEEGLIFASDSRTHAGVDNYAKFCKMTVFERAGDRVLVLLSSRRPGRHAGGDQRAAPARRRPSRRTSGAWPRCSTWPTWWPTRCATSSAATRPFMEGGGLKFNASFILGGQIAGEDMRLFRLYAEGNFIEAGSDTPFLQTGEAKYGKPILDLAVTRSATLEDATKCVLVSFDSTMLSNLSVGMPIDLLCYARDSLRVTMQRRFDTGDAYFETLKQQLDRRHAPHLPRPAGAALADAGRDGARRLTSPRTEAEAWRIRATPACRAAPLPSPGPTARTTVAVRGCAASSRCLTAPRAPSPGADKPTGMDCVTQVTESNGLGA